MGLQAVILILLLLVLLKAYDFVESTSRAEASSFQAQASTAVPLGPRRRAKTGAVGKESNT